MIRERVRLKIYRLDEETMQRRDEFDYTEEQRSEIKDELELLLNGQHLIGWDGIVYTVGVAGIEDDE